MEHAPIIQRPKIVHAMLSWLVKILFNCTSGRYAINLPLSGKQSAQLRHSASVKSTPARVTEGTPVSSTNRGQ